MEKEKSLTMKNKIVFIAIVVIAALCSLPIMAQKEFTLEDLNYGGTRYYQMVPENRYTTWWGDKLIHTEVDYCAEVNKQTAQEQTLFTLDDVNQWIGTSDSVRVHHFYEASFPYSDQPLVLVSTGKENLLVNWKQHKVVWRTPSKVSYQAEKWNSSSRATAFVDNNQLFVRDAAGKVHQLSTDGSRSIVYGQSVHRDEFGISEGLFWSPKGQRLAFYRMDQSMVADYPQVDIFQREATYEPDKYPMAGETSHKVTVGVYDLRTNDTIWLKAGDPTNRYFTNIAWSPDENFIYMFELNCDQNDCRLVCYDAKTGNKISELYRETDDKYVEPLHPILFLPWDSNKFLLQSQKDGYNHLYLFDKNGKQLKQVTSGSWVVMDVLGFNTKSHSVIIASNEPKAIQRNIFSVNIDNGKRTLIDCNGDGWHNASISTSGRYVLDNYQTPTIPRVIDLIDTQSHHHTTYLKAKNPWEGYTVPEYSCGTIKAADGMTDLYYRMVKPTHFDPNKKYPTIIYVYGGPHAHNVDARWHYCSRSWETYMAQKGYLLFILDNRGSENRGKVFEQVTFRQLGQEEMKDQMKGVDFLKSLPYVDANRIGVHGWSFGGFMTISLMTNYPDVFKVGVAGGPVIDWKWYEVMYGERYMDTPQTNPEGYAKTSLINKAKDLRGKLQIIIGLNDATVVPQHALSFLAECIKVGTQPDFFVYPGEPHNMRGHQSVHLHERITQYFEDYLK